jgi:glycosyltransferase involved in cell wall biosynthesis
MYNLALFLLVFNLLLLAITLLNTFTVRVVRGLETPDISEFVSILIPLRNESQNVPGLIESVINQKGLSRYEVLALDDNSSDDTAEQIRKHSAPILNMKSGAALPDGWLGKNFACHQLAQEAEGEYLVFVDADVRLSPFAVSSSIAFMKGLKWDFLSPYPRQIAITFLERLAQPLLQWSWFASLPLRLAEKLQRPSMVVANGQFFIVSRAAYLKTGGHEAIKSEVLDDLELGRSLVRAGYSGGVADGSKIAFCRMYNSAKELIEGYSKSQWRAFGSPIGAVLAAVILFATSILPITLGLSGETLGWYGYFALVTSRLLVALKTDSVISSASLHPLSAGLWIYLIFISWYRKGRGELIWRGRHL